MPDSSSKSRRPYNDILSDLKDLRTSALPVCGIIDHLADSEDSREGLHYQFVPFLWIYPDLLGKLWEDYKSLNDEVEWLLSLDADFDKGRYLRKLLFDVRCAHAKAENARRSLPDSASRRFATADMAGMEAEGATHGVDIRAERLGENLGLLEAVFNPFVETNEFNPHLQWKYCGRAVGAVSDVLDFVQRENESIASVVGPDSAFLKPADAESRISKLKSGLDGLIDRFKALKSVFSEGEE